jgi:hypothetical protein
MAAADRRALLAAYEGFELLPPAEVGQPAPYSRSMEERRHWWISNCASVYLEEEVKSYLGFLLRT